MESQSNSYLDCLNENQKKAVIHEGSSLLILAGAGSGKTRVITTKIAYLISEKHVSPSQILAVTFTKKAAQEMKERAVNLEPLSQYAQIRTFHSFGSYFLRKYYYACDVEQNFTVYDDDDMVTIINKIYPQLKKKEASHYAHLISLAKDYCLLPDDENLCQIDSEPLFPEIYEKYQKRLRQTGNVDFGDLILMPYLVLKENPHIRSEIHNRYKVIMVDEYQDSNVAQFKLLKMLSGVDEGNDSYVCVVGDDDQSIYKFRGAEVKNILDFQKEFGKTEIIRLEENYRSTDEILKCAQSVVKNNRDRLGKDLISVRGKGKTPALVFLPNQDDETEFCANIIEKSVDKGGLYSDWAILYRTNAQSLGFETTFLHKKIPYQVVGSLKFYEREEIKDAISWISFILNPKDEISFRRIVNKPVRGIGPTSQEKIVDACIGYSFLEAKSKIKLSGKADKGLDEFINLAKSFIDKLPSVPQENDISALVNNALETPVNVKKTESKLTLGDFVDEVIKASELEEFHKGQDEIEGTQKVLNLHEFVNSATLYPYSVEGLTDFLDHVNLDRTLDTEDDGDTDKVTLITLHNTKGLEFKNVVITGMENGIFPREDKSLAEMEEERRIFYVGITRAQNELYFTSCAVRRM